jgi:Zn-dependent protease with chaperone function
MNQQIEFEVVQKEKIYFSIKVIMSLIIYALIIFGINAVFSIDNPASAGVVRLLAVYILMFISFVFFRSGIFIGYLKGNAVKVTPSQFPEINSIVQKQSDLLGLSTVPDVYILQSGGLLNAFATRFFGSNYIVLYSEIVDAALEKDKNLLEFIIGHELGHIKRKHLIKKLILFPSFIVPFLGPAYSRACEYTCDNIGYALSPLGARNGLLLLASGKNLFSKVNTTEYIKQGYSEDGFWKWFAEKVSSHPNTTKRIIKFRETSAAPPPKAEAALELNETEDHSRYFPK